MRAEVRAWIDAQVAILASSFPVEVEGPDDLRERVGELDDRLRAAAT
jgi:hypothetical protein